MTALQLNAELLRQLSYIADDETYLRKALNTIKRLVAEKKNPKMNQSEWFLRKRIVSI